MTAAPPPARRTSARWIWFDVENTPHVHSLAPLIRGVQSAGHRVRVTARGQAQTLELAALFGLTASPIGGGDHRGRGRKTVAVLTRALRLAAWALRKGRPALLVSSSRSACLAARLTGIRSVALLDYEHAEQRTLATSDVLWFPDVLRDAALPWSTRRVAAFYEGLKENLYLDQRSFDRKAERAALDLGADERLVVGRPPADLAHYHRVESWDLWVAVCRRVLMTPGTRLVVMPRTRSQAAAVRVALPAASHLRVLDHAVDGPALVAAADLVVGGGGTINREAAVLGTPVWSVFAGPRPFIDETLSREGRLQWIGDGQAAATVAFPFVAARRPRGPFPAGLRRLLADIGARARPAGLRRAEPG